MIIEIFVGYNFEQDSQRLKHSFWRLEHRFIEFTSSVVNIDEVASDIQRRFNIIGIDETTASSIEDTSGAAAETATGTAGATVPLPKTRSKTAKPKGLSKLVQMCFGKPLDKRECISNWQNKPLRPEQLRYAALDSFVLIKIHDLFTAKFKELNIDFDYRR